ncbi:hypothetical protein BAJUN_01920 [Bajunvirus bajun]|uniref:Uncharacterized protein n=1 Tax=Brevundimonas phage vB_BgoS-Bajun TaxID=2948594 RepID=A0A9E7N749_9CAUD|nr:hypothetical protein BAJUN_01920 [Brevundimonas phage vB_BgoS-Bajun]
MQKRHFEAVAADIRRAYQQAESDGERRGCYAVAHNLAETFAAANPLFDRQRFLVACGVVAGG